MYDDFSKVLSSAMETTNVYGITKYGVHLPVAITESNRMDGRMLSTMTSTMALLRAPDKVVGRMHYDYRVSVDLFYIIVTVEVWGGASSH